MGYLYNKKVSSYRELKDHLHMAKGQISGTMFYLCKMRKLLRLPFSTKFGKIVYLPKTPMKQVWEYCYKNNLIPTTTEMFMKLLAKNRVVSTLELYDKGLDITDVRFFIDAFTKQWKLFKITKVEGFNIFYHDEAELELYISQNIDKLKKLQQKEWKRRTKEGREFEERIEKFYQIKGFDTQRNLFFTTKDQERLEIDILASKQFFPMFKRKKPIFIAVQCKNWMADRHAYNLTEFLTHYTKLKSIFPSALFHVWSYNFSKFFWNPSFFKRFPDVSFFYSKHIREAFKEIGKLKVKA